MPVREKKLPTKEIEILISGGLVARRFIISKEMAKGILYLIKDKEVSPTENLPWRESSKTLIATYTEAGVVLRGARAKEGLSQSELAKKLGIPQSHISEMENGKRPIGKKMAKALASALNISYRVFLV